MLLTENIDIHNDVHYCKNVQCTDTLHRHAIDSLCNNFTDSCIKVSLEIFPVSKSILF